MKGEEESRVQVTNNLEVLTFHSFLGMEDLSDAWDAFVEKEGGDIYQTYDWCRVWWDFYGSGRELRIFIFYGAREMVGIVPLFVDKLGFGPISVKVGKLVGSDSTISIVSPVVKEAWGLSVYEYILEEMLKRRGCDALVFGPSAKSCSSVDFLVKAVARIAGLPVAKVDDSGVYSKFQVTESIDGYLESLSKREKRHVRQDLKQVESRYRLSVDVLSNDDGLVDEFEAFVGIHEEQWRAQGKLGHFGDWPLSYEFTRAMLIAQAKKQRVRFVRLSCDECVVLYKLCFAFGRRWHWRLPARRLGEEWDKLGFGRLGILKMIECASQEGIQEIEAGPGHYAYKVKMGAVEEKLISVVLAHAAGLKHLRAKCFLAFADFLHLVYYRVWFLKVAPRMPWRQGPLWRLWIRTRV